MSSVLGIHSVRKVFRSYHFNNKFTINTSSENFRSVFEPVRLGPQSVRFGRVKCKMLHRVSVRNVLDAISTTESEEIYGELGGIDTTHSSIIESEELGVFV